MKKYLLILAVLFAAACNSESEPRTSANTDGGGNPPPAGKSLFSVWNNNEGRTLDLTGLTFGDNAYSFVLPTGECNCTLSLQGSEASGAFSIHTCSGVGIMTSSACEAAVGQEGTYQMNGSEMTVCPSGSSCDTYQ